MIKKSLLFFALGITNLNIQSQLKIELIKAKSDNPKLSFWQRFELDYLQQELKLFSKKIAADWTNDKNTRILIERTELAVQESDKKSQDFMKQQIIEIFEKFGIDIFFTSDNFIQRVVHKKITHQQLPHKFHIDDQDENESDSSHIMQYHFHNYSDQDDQSTISQDSFEEIRSKKSVAKPHKKTDTTTQINAAPQQLHRIHGGRRTLNKIKKRWAEQEKEQEESIRKLLQKNDRNFQKNKETTINPYDLERRIMSQNLVHTIQDREQRSAEQTHEPSSSATRQESPEPIIFV